MAQTRKDGQRSLEPVVEADGSEELTPAARMFIFILFTQVMQALMSYDGGATQMSTSSLLENGWSSSELGLLGAMDKFGQVGAAVAVSSLLMKYDNKLLLLVGLFAKASSCLGFGILSDKMLMLASKLGMGGSEALIGVWATVWVQGHAPRDAQARWLGFASISAGLGNGAGSAVAGLCSKSMGYAFAFVCQAVVLFFCLFVMIFTPAKWFDFVQNEPQEEELWPSEKDAQRELDEFNAMESNRFRTVSYVGVRSRSELQDPRLFLQQEAGRRISYSFDETHSSMARLYSLNTSFTSFDEGHRRLSTDDVSYALPPLREQATSESLMASRAAERSTCEAIKLVLKSRLWLWTAVAISLSAYILASVSYLWQNTVMNVWDFDNAQATWSFLCTTGVGGFIGVALGPKVFDDYLQGFDTAPKKAKCLQWCVRAALAVALLGAACAALFWETAYKLLHYEVPHQPKGGPLVLVLVSIFAVFAFVNSMQGTLYGINTDSVTLELRPSAASLTVALTNIIGYASGTLLPGIAADMAGGALTNAFPTEKMQVIRSAQFTVGMAVALLAGWPLLLSLHLGKKAAQANVNNQGENPDELLVPSEDRRGQASI